MKAATLVFALSCVGLVAADPSKLPPAVGRPIDFARDVRPIFKEHCYSCHGPEKQKSGYRLDVKSVALTEGDGSAPNIVPHKSAESPLIRFVGGLEDTLMPEKGDPLTAEQIGVLRAWIDQGATWPDDEPKVATRADVWKEHWAFKPVTRPPVPSPAGRGPIDAFLAEKLAAKKLGFAPEADRRTLIRRLSFDLVGLPPTPSEIETFLADPASDAYEQLVDRLLASPHYGERWARHWLDVVRFAESDGYERNNFRQHAWPYRDYVIRALNEDKPYDQFVREQIAGDAYGIDAATGFLVGGSWDVLRLIDPPTFDHQQRADELYDMASTTGSAFMGLTVGCARCHDHKFDPVSQQDFYSLTAVFQGVRHGERPWRPENHEAMRREVAGVEKRLAKIETTLAPFVAQARLGRTVLVEEGDEGELLPHAPGAERGQAGDRGDELRLPTPSEAARGSIAKAGTPVVHCWTPGVAGRFRLWVSWSTRGDNSPDAMYHIANDTTRRPLGRVDQRRFSDGAAAVAGEQRWSGFHSLGTHELTAGARIELSAGDSAGRLTADTLLLEEIAPGATPVEVAVPHVRAPVVPKANEERFAPVQAKFLRFTIAATNEGDAALDEVEVFPVSPAARNIAHMEWGAKATGSRVKGRDGNPFYIHDGVFHEVGNWTMPVTEPVWVQLEFAEPHTINRIVWSRNRSERGPQAAEKGLPVDYRFEVSLDGKNWQPVASSADRLAERYRKRVTKVPTLSGVPAAKQAAIAELVAERRKLGAQIAHVTNLPPIYSGRFNEPGPTHRLHRGEVTAKRERLGPSAITYFGRKLDLPLDAPERQRRVKLAGWIASPEHPLTARVLVNRIWHYHFGTGIVDTPSDFGINGARPTHPELLDWLAAEFVDRRWSIKALHRLIVTSAAYRQSAQSRPEGLAADSNSRLLWRFPPRRLEAEALRDTMLAVTGLLNLHAGGPGFSLFLPDPKNSRGIEPFIPKTEFSPDDFRRMIYQRKPRVQLDDVFGAFDCPDAGQIAPARTSTTTPLQAFNLLNSPFALQLGAAFAARIEREAGADVDAQVQRGFALAFGRTPDSDERAAARALIKKHGLPLFCRGLFNANEFVFVH